MKEDIEWLPKSKGDMLFAATKGLSMNPTLGEAEIIEVAPLGARPIRPGDVVYFQESGKGPQVVHRVIRITPAGLITRGDNNRRPDPSPLPAAAVIGRVVGVWRGQKRRPVSGGQKGLFLSRWLQGRSLLVRSIAPWLRPPYRLFVRWGCLQHLLPLRWRPRLLIFQDGSRQRAQLMIGRHSAGSFNAANHRWRIKPPFRLFIDEAKLPTMNEPGSREFDSVQTENEGASSLLLGCLRGEFDFRKFARPAGPSPAAWKAVLEEATRQGLAPRLYQLLKAHVSEMNIPPGVFQELQKQYFLNAAKNTLLYHAFSKIVQSLKARGVPVIPLKGIYLAEGVYGSRDWRSIGDIDLLVEKKGMKNAENALLALGFRPFDRNRVIAQDIVHFAYRNPNSGLVVDIHWNILPPSLPIQVDVDGLWNRSRSAALAGQEVRALSPEDQILYLCSHITKHAFQTGLRSVIDIFEVIRHFKKEIDWGLAAGRARQWGNSKSVYIALRLSRELLKAEAPEQYLEELRPEAFKESLYRLAKSEVISPRHPNCEGLRLSLNVARLWGNKGFPARVGFFLRRTFPSRAEMARMYPAGPSSWKIFFYYPYRAGDLLLRHGRSVWQRLRVEKEAKAFTEHEKALNSLRDWILSP